MGAGRKGGLMSLIQQNKVCYVCGTTQGLHKHHIFYGTGNRKLSEADGCYCYLCYLHHNGSNKGVHFNRALDLELKRRCELAWLHVNKLTVEDFIKRYGKNYI